MFEDADMIFDEEKVNESFFEDIHRDDPENQVGSLSFYKTSVQKKGLNLFEYSIASNFFLTSYSNSNL